MESVTRMMRQFAAIMVVIGGLLLPTTDGLIPVGLVIAVVALAAVDVAWSLGVPTAAVVVDLRVRATLDRVVPTAAQSDPDARGHARPRAPGRLLPAI
ncbi:MAG: hypothetical protein HIU88_10760 [Acidobacteria bacterium]|nr:hypothetical protein [Acidobacteriota bacterium]